MEYINEIGTYMICFGIMGFVIGIMFDQVAIAAVKTSGKARVATKKNQLPRNTAKFKAPERSSWQKF